MDMPRYHFNSLSSQQRSRDGTNFGSAFETRCQGDSLWRDPTSQASHEDEALTSVRSSVNFRFARVHSIGQTSRLDSSLLLVQFVQSFFHFVQFR